MTGSDTRIFLSYRREDTQWAARGLYEELNAKYGAGNVFRDLDAIPPGVRFRSYIERRISDSTVFILLIGGRWATIEDDAGRRRIGLPRDPVRIELECALRQQIPIIPVRIDGAPMPTESDLVPSILDLLEFNAADLSDVRWSYDVGRLLAAIDNIVSDTADASRPLSVDSSDRSAVRPVRSPRGAGDDGVRWPVIPSGPPERRERLSNDPDALLSHCSTSSDEKLFMTVSKGSDEQKKVRVWNCRDPSLRATLVHDDPLEGVAVSPGSETLATQERDSPVVRLWDLPNGTLRDVLEFDTSVDTFEFSPDGAWLCVGGGGRALQLWDVAGRRFQDRAADAGLVGEWEFSPDGRWLVSYREGAWSSAVWELAAGRLRGRVEHGEPISGQEFDPTGTWLTIRSKGASKLYDVATGRPYLSSRRSAPALWPEFSADGRWLAIQGGLAAPTGVDLVDIQEGRLRCTLDTPRHCWNIHFSNHGDMVATGSYGPEIQLWDTASGRLRHTLVNDSWVSVPGFSPDDRFLAVTCYDSSSLILWDVTTGDVHRTFEEGSNNSVFSDFSPDGTLLWTHAFDADEVKLWDVRTGALRHSLSRPTKPFRASFEIGGSCLAVVNEDDGYLVWEI